MYEEVDRTFEEVADLAALLYVYDNNWWIMHDEGNLCIIMLKNTRTVQATCLRDALRAALALYGAA